MFENSLGGNLKTEAAKHTALSALSVTGVTSLGATITQTKGTGMATGYVAVSAATTDDEAEVVTWQAWLSSFTDVNAWDQMTIIYVVLIGAAVGLGALVVGMLMFTKEVQKEKERRASADYGLGYGNKIGAPKLADSHRPIEYDADFGSNKNRALDNAKYDVDGDGFIDGFGMGGDLEKNIDNTLTSPKKKKKKKVKTSGVSNGHSPFGGSASGDGGDGEGGSPTSSMKKKKKKKKTVSTSQVSPGGLNPDEEEGMA